MSNKKQWEFIKGIFDSAENCVLISDIHQLTGIDYDEISNILQKHTNEIQTTMYQGKTYYSKKSIH